MTPLAVSAVAIALWTISWLVASIWSRRTAARPSSLDQAVHLIPTMIGAALIFLGSRVRFGAQYHAIGDAPLWRLPDNAGWTLFGLCIVGLAFTWWARLTLGDLWSSNVARKDDHVIVDRGPYRLVRHPIYTGLILALATYAAQLATPAGMVGVLLVAFGFWLKARLEERFLGSELGEAAYAAYRARTPMLVPFWPMRG